MRFSAEQYEGKADPDDALLGTHMSRYFDSAATAACLFPLLISKAIFLLRMCCMEQRGRNGNPMACRGDDEQG